MRKDMLIKAVTVLVTASMLLLSGCCKQETLAKMDSPDKAVSAVVGFQDCGATDAGSTSLTLKFNHTWFGAKDTIFATKYEHPFEMRWKSNSELVVYCSGCKPEEVRFQKAKSRTVKIQYKFGVAGLDY